MVSCTESRTALALTLMQNQAESVHEQRDVKQTPSDTHAHEESETTLSVREVSAHTDPLFLKNKCLS